MKKTNVQPINVKLSDLILWEDNPRIDQRFNEDNDDKISFLIKRITLKRLKNMIESVTAKWDNGEAPTIYKKNDKYFVIDGNTRVLALQFGAGILEHPNIKRLNLISPNEKILCLEYSNLDEAKKMIERRHGQTPVSPVNWNPLEKQYYTQRESPKYTIDLFINDFILYLKAENSDMYSVYYKKSSLIKRIMQTKKFKSSIYTVPENKESDIPPKNVVDFFQEVILKKQTSRTLNTVADINSFIDNFLTTNLYQSTGDSPPPTNTITTPETPDTNIEVSKPKIIVDQILTSVSLNRHYNLAMLVDTSKSSPLRPKVISYLPKECINLNEQNGNIEFIKNADFYEITASFTSKEDTNITKTFTFKFKPQVTPIAPKTIDDYFHFTINFNVSPVVFPSQLTRLLKEYEYMIDHTDIFQLSIPIVYRTMLDIILSEILNKLSIEKSHLFAENLQKVNSQINSIIDGSILDAQDKRTMQSPTHKLSRDELNELHGYTHGSTSTIDMAKFQKGTSSSVYQSKINFYYTLYHLL